MNNIGALEIRIDFNENTKVNMEKKDEIPILKSNIFELVKLEFELVIKILEDAKFSCQSCI